MNIPGDIASFRTLTSRGFTIQPSFTFSGVGNQDSIALTRTGWLASIFGVMTITVTTGAAGTYSAGSNNGIPAPYAFIRRMVLESNNSFQLRNYDGWSNYLEQLQIRAANIIAPNPAYKSSNTQTAIYSYPSSFAASTTYTINIPINIDVVFSRAMSNMLGLLLLNSDNSTMYLRMTWGQGTDLIATSGGTVTVNNVTFTPVAEVYSPPPPQTSPSNPTGPAYMVNPRFEYVKQIMTTQDTSGISAGGTYQPTNPPYGGSLLSVVQTYVNNSALMVPANFGNIRTQFNSTMTPETLPLSAHLMRIRNLYDGQDFPDGVIIRPYFDSNNMVDAPGLDNAIPTTDTTSLIFQTDIAAGVTLTNPSCYNMYTFLRALNGPAG